MIHMNGNLLQRIHKNIHMNGNWLQRVHMNHQNFIRIGGNLRRDARLGRPGWFSSPRAPGIGRETAAGAAFRVAAARRAASAAAGGPRAPERTGRSLLDSRCLRRKRAIRVGALPRRTGVIPAARCDDEGNSR